MQIDFKISVITKYVLRNLIEYIFIKIIISLVWE